MALIDQMADSFSQTGKAKERKIPKENKTLFPKGQEAAFYMLINAVLNNLQGELTSEIENQGRFRYRGDSLNEDNLDEWLANVSTYNNLVNRSFDKALLTRLLFRFQRNMVKFNAKQVKKSYEKFSGVDLLAYSDDIIDTTRAQTEASISSIQELGDDIKAKMEKQVFRGMREGLRHEDLVKRIQTSLKGEKGIFKSAKKRAKLIARNEVSSFNGALTKKRNENLGIKFFEWQAINDDRVRKEGGKNGKPSKTNHLAMDGHVFPWGKDRATIVVDGKKYSFKPAPKGIFGDTMYPGSEINCRCVARSLITKRLEQKIRVLAKTKSPSEVVRELQGF